MEIAIWNSQKRLKKTNDLFPNFLRKSSDQYKITHYLYTTLSAITYKFNYYIQFVEYLA